MNFQQLRIVRETVRQGYNLTEVANTLYTSQPGVSKHIRDLEEELGVELFVRKGKRLMGLTDPGKELLVVVERMLLDARNIKNLAEQYSSRDVGQLTVVTTHTQARYSLPEVVSAFKRLFPKVHLRLHQGSPKEITQMLLDGQADIGIATEVLGNVDDLVSFPYYQWKHQVIVKNDHPLLQLDKPTLADVAEYPVITYQEGFTGRIKIDETFAAHGLNPDIAISALDADVIKTYVELGLGVGIIANMAFSRAKDTGLSLLNIDNPFPVNTTSIAVRKGHYLRSFAYKFIELCNAELSESRLQSVLNERLVD
ncbi:MAG TPA: CysB family HTH-type transcriptional regulator [Limnobacter sp.]|uniref:CysB family HTH-type transcriptional regulator n=1 Tax=Limnobacter sp. TaxID=2003368 RepID=UPI002ED79B97